MHSLPVVSIFLHMAIDLETVFQNFNFWILLILFGGIFQRTSALKPPGTCSDQNLWESLKEQSPKIIIGILFFKILSEIFLEFLEFNSAKEYTSGIFSKISSTKHFRVCIANTMGIPGKPLQAVRNRFSKFKILVSKINYKMWISSL